MRYIFILIFFTLVINTSKSQKIVEPALIKWYTFEEADSLSKIVPKPIFVDVYTDWCSWCKHMSKTTFANKGIAGYINTNFYPVRFNAETTDTITYNGKTYTNKGVGRKPKHDLATLLMNGRYSFPTITYIDTKRKIYPVPGYKSISDIEPILVYFAENLQNNVNYIDFEMSFMFTYPKNFKKRLAKIPDSVKLDTTGKVNWLSLEEAEKQSKISNKPIYIYFYTDWCQNCKVYEGAVLKDKNIANTINSKFCPVKFNAASQETVHLFGNTIKGNGKGQPHKLTQMLLKKNFIFPAVVLINSKKQKLDEIHGFINIENSEYIMNYFADENYLKQSYKDFVKTFKKKKSNK